MTRRLAGALAAVVAAAVAHAAGVPRVVLEGPVVDFGTVERGATVERTFRLRNAGDGELSLEHVKPSCGCTAAVVSARTVAPDAEGRVLVTLDTRGMAGRVTKTVTVYTNDPDAVAVGLTLTGQVLADLVAAPAPLYLGKLRRGVPMQGEVRVMPGRPDGTAAVIAVEQTNPALRTRVAPVPDGPGQRVLVEVDPRMPLGRFYDVLTLVTTSSREPVMTLPVFGSVEGDVLVLPAEVSFGVTHGERAPAREVFIRNRGREPVAVTRVAVPQDVASYRLRAVERGREYRVTVRLRDDLPPGKVEKAIEIFTDHPNERRLVVPLHAIVRAGRRRG